MGNKNCRLHTQDKDKTPENLSVSCLPAASFYFIVRRQYLVLGLGRRDLFKGKWDGVDFNHSQASISCILHSNDSYHDWLYCTGCGCPITPSRLMSASKKKKPKALTHGKVEVQIRESSIVKFVLEVGSGETAGLFGFQNCASVVLESRLEPRIGSDAYFKACEQIRNNAHSIELLLQDLGIPPKHMNEMNYKTFFSGIKGFLVSPGARNVFVQGYLEASAIALEYMEGLRTMKRNLLSEREAAEVKFNSEEARKLVSIQSDVPFWLACVKIFSVLNLTGSCFSKVVEEEVEINTRANNEAENLFRCDLVFTLQNEMKSQEFLDQWTKTGMITSFRSVEYVQMMKSPYAPLNFFHDFFLFKPAREEWDQPPKSPSSKNPAPTITTPLRDAIFRDTFSPKMNPVSPVRKGGNGLNTSMYDNRSPETSFNGSDFMEFNDNDESHFDSVNGLEDVSVVSISGTDSSGGEDNIGNLLFE